MKETNTSSNLSIDISKLNIKDVATAFYYADNPEKQAIELSTNPSYISLSDENKRFLDKHINEALISYYLKRLNYVVCENQQLTLEAIRNHNTNNASNSGDN